MPLQNYWQLDPLTKMPSFWRKQLIQTPPFGASSEKLWKNSLLSSSPTTGRWAEWAAQHGAHGFLPLLLVLLHGTTQQSLSHKPSHSQLTELNKSPSVIPWHPLLALLLHVTVKLSSSSADFTSHLPTSNLRTGRTGLQICHLIKLSF